MLLQQEALEKVYSCRSNWSQFTAEVKQNYTRLDLSQTHNLAPIGIKEVSTALINTRYVSKLMHT